MTGIMHVRSVLQVIEQRWTQYHAGPNLFERFRGVLELISRFEFEFRRCENYFF